MGKIEKKKSGKSVWIWSVTAAISVLLLWSISLYMLVDLPDRGTFGDMFGAVNALFSGFAFAGVIIAIILQSQELKAQREELILTRDQLEGQKTALEGQNKTLIQQRFENTFFQMLSLHNEIVNAIVLRDGARDRLGRDALKILSIRVFKAVEEAKKNDGEENAVSLAVEGYSKAYHVHQSILGHYFRILYRVVKFVDESGVDDKEGYIKILRAQLSNQELELLFFNCLSKRHGAIKFKSFVEKYALLDNLSTESFSKQMELIKCYEQSAYGEGYPEN